MNKQSNISPDLLFHIANGFYDIGYSIASKAKNEQYEIRPQRLATAVVNFSFAVELYLKMLYAITTKSVLTGHQFLYLYKQLPDSIKSMVEGKYNENKQKAGRELGKFKITFALKDSEKDSDTPLIAK
jgi:hypothetical protein